MTRERGVGSPSRCLHPLRDGVLARSPPSLAALKPTLLIPRPGRGQRSTVRKHPPHTSRPLYTCIAFNMSSAAAVIAVEAGSVRKPGGQDRVWNTECCYS